MDTEPSVTDSSEPGSVSGAGAASNAGDMADFHSDEDMSSTLGRTWHKTEGRSIRSVIKIVGISVLGTFLVGIVAYVVLRQTGYITQPHLSQVVGGQARGSYSKQQHGSGSRPGSRVRTSQQGTRSKEGTKGPIPKTKLLYISVAVGAVLLIATVVALLIVSRPQSVIEVPPAVVPDNTVPAASPSVNWGREVVAPVVVVGVFGLVVVGVVVKLWRMPSPPIVPIGETVVSGDIGGGGDAPPNEPYYWRHSMSPQYPHPDWELFTSDEPMRKVKKYKENLKTDMRLLFESARNWDPFSPSHEIILHVYGYIDQFKIRARSTDQVIYWIVNCRDKEKYRWKSDEYAANKKEFERWEKGLKRAKGKQPAAEKKHLSMLDVDHMEDYYFVVCDEGLKALNTTPTVAGNHYWLVSFDEYCAILDMSPDKDMLDFYIALCDIWSRRYKGKPADAAALNMG